MTPEHSNGHHILKMTFLYKVWLMGKTDLISPIICKFVLDLTLVGHQLA